MSIFLRGGMSYLIHIKETWCHQDHLGIGLDVKVKVACINEVCDGPS